ncbi:hypothetical protein ACIA8O_26855 [Kitasatospora sp. NPDC051853]|uniref:hypothetical protein n=1 Tax=Kitasatospora sp. NPDC051853 TaxID=3364058 RepID=UPI003789326C
MVLTTPRARGQLGRPCPKAGDLTLFPAGTTAIAAVVSFAVWGLLGYRGRLYETMAGAPP